MNDINGFLKRRWPAMIASLLICICAGFGYAWSVLLARIPNALVLSAVNIVLLRILLENRSLMKLAKK